MEDQISIESSGSVPDLPVREGLWHQPDFDRCRGLIEADLKNQVFKLEELGRVNEALALNNRINEALERLAEGHQLPGADQFLPWIETNWLPCLIIYRKPE